MGVYDIDLALVTLRQGGTLLTALALSAQVRRMRLAPRRSVARGASMTARWKRSRGNSRPESLNPPGGQGGCPVQERQLAQIACMICRAHALE